MAGSDAIEIGLIDAFGGMDDAINDVAERANIGADSVKVKYYPEVKKDELLQFLEAFEEGSASVTAQSALEAQLMDIYSYLKTIDNKKSIQARLPYLFWVR